MNMTINEIQCLAHPVDKLILVSLCGMHYQLFAEVHGKRFAVCNKKGEKIVSQSLDQGKQLIRGLQCKSAVLYQQLPNDEACVAVAGEMSPGLEIPIMTHSI